MTPVHVLLTCDIHTHIQSAEQVDRDLRHAREALRAGKWPCTFLFPAVSAELLSHHLDGLRAEGHEIGCHGLTHHFSENFGVLPLAEQQSVLTRATERLTKLLGESPMTFRAPVFKVSGQTMRALEDLGYLADVSINAGRLGVFGSDIYSIGPLLAPRRPYHPSQENPFRRGRLKLWEIPVSAIGLPFLSNTERFAGLALVKRLFDVLYWEARVAGKPIVFVFHAEDLNVEGGVEPIDKFKWRYFLPTRTHGFQFRFFLLERNWAHVHRDIVALLSYIQGCAGVQFMTVRDYVRRLNQLAGSSC